MPGYEWKAVESSKPLFMCMGNWGEVYYQIASRFGEQKTQEIEQLIQTLPITLVEANKELTREAARIKATKQMAYADRFAVALARLKKVERSESSWGSSSWGSVMGVRSLVLTFDFGWSKYILCLGH